MKDHNIYLTIYFNLYNLQSVVKKEKVNLKTQMSESWHYVDKFGTSRGPCTIEEMISGYCSGDLFDRTYVWNGVTVKTWTPISNLPKLFDRLERARIHYLAKSNPQIYAVLSPGVHGVSAAAEVDIVETISVPKEAAQRVPVIEASTTTTANENQIDFPSAPPASKTNISTPQRPSLNKNNTFNVHHSATTTNKGIPAVGPSNGPNNVTSISNGNLLSINPTITMFPSTHTNVLLSYSPDVDLKFYMYQFARAHNKFILFSFVCCASNSAEPTKPIQNKKKKKSGQESKKSPKKKPKLEKKEQEDYQDDAVQTNSTHIPSETVTVRGLPSQTTTNDQAKSPSKKKQVIKKWPLSKLVIMHFPMFHHHQVPHHRLLPLNKSIIYLISQPKKK
ncbi:RNA binding protein, partial [Reticulomyxa filosa]